MKTYTPEQLNTALEFVKAQVKKEVLDVPDGDAKPIERAAAIMEPLTLAVKLAGLLDQPTLQALVMRKFGGANDADRDQIRDYLDKIPGVFEQVKAPA